MILSAIISPLFYWSIQSLAGLWPIKIFTYLAEKDFPRYFDRLRMIPIIITLPFLFKSCGLFSLNKLGLGFQESWLQKSMLYFLIGVIMMAVIAITQFQFSNVEIRVGTTFSFILTSLLSALISGLLLGLIEEIVFRGLVFRMFYSAFNSSLAVILSALFFASLHFKKIPDTLWPENTTVTFISGFYIAFYTVTSFLVTFSWIKFLNLFLVGVLLNLLFLRKKSLWPCIGLHAGWVWFRALYKKVFESQYPAIDWFFGTHLLTDGIITSVMLLAIIVWVFSKKNTMSSP